MNFMEDMSARFSPMNGRRISRGFTLIELLVTIAIIAIAVGIGVPAYSTFTQGSAVSGATSELLGALNDARSRATAERGTIQVRAMAGGWASGLEIYRLNTLGDASDDELLFSVVRVAGKVTVSEVGNATVVDFDRAGRATARTFNIGIVSAPAGSPTRQLVINALGRTTITSGLVP